MFDTRMYNPPSKPKVQIKNGAATVNIKPIDIAAFLNPGLVQPNPEMEMYADDEMDYGYASPDFQVADDQYLMDDDDYDEEEVPSLEDQPITEEEIMAAEAMLDEGSM